MSLTLHGIAASRALRPLWAATELGLEFQHVPTPFGGGATRTPEFLALNPNGHIPVLVDARPEGEVVVWESMACALYLARVHGHADGVSIAPATPREEAEALRWSFWVVTECEADALTVLMHRVAMPEARRKPELADAAEKRLAVPLRVIESHPAAPARGRASLAGGRTIHRGRSVCGQRAVVGACLAGADAGIPAHARMGAALRGATGLCGPAPRRLIRSPRPAGAPPSRWRRRSAPRAPSRRAFPAS